jgi:transposase
MTQKALTTAQFFKSFPDDETCLQHLFDVRFGQGFECPSCERSTRWYRIKAERAYSCQYCGHHLHPTVGTPFAKTRTPLQLWFYAIHLFTTTRHGVSAKELERQLGVTYKTAWRMAHEIRKHMASIDGNKQIGGFTKRVEIDETFVGGHEATRNWQDGKTIVLGMMERGGDVVTAVVQNRKRATLFPEILANVKAHSIVHTDEMTAYLNLGNFGFYHEMVNHSAGQYVSPTGASTNSIEGFWRHLKSSIAGTHIWVSGKHLGKYAKEFEYRFNRRNEAHRMLPELLSTFLPSPLKSR